MGTAIERLLGRRPARSSTIAAGYGGSRPNVLDGRCNSGESILVTCHA